MGHADPPARSNIVAWARCRQKGSVVGRNEKRIRTQNRSANHLKLRSSQHRRRRRQSVAQTGNRTAGRSEETLIFSPGQRSPRQILTGWIVTGFGNTIVVAAGGRPSSVLLISRLR